jgi:hypothetical protein
MAFQDLLSIAGSILVALGGASVVLFALGKWLGGVWATRIIDSERAQAAREQERLGRQRSAYAKLSAALRVFLRHEGENWEENRNTERAKFHEAYDEAALWASDEVMNSIGTFLDLIKKVQELPSSVPQDVLINAYTECISSMRRDCGFPKTSFKYRVVHF